MNFIVFCRSTKGTRHFALTPPLLGGLALSAVALLGGCFGIGFGMARSLGFVPADERIRDLQQSIADQQAAVDRARNAAQDQVNALAIRVGSLNAHVIRLNALGGRLAEMAKLDDGEFDFSTPPGVGGPDDEPAVGPAGVPDIGGELDVLDTRLDHQQRQLSILATLLVDRKLSEEIRPRGRPVKVGFISSYFGHRTDPFTGETREHRGIDFAAKTGTEIVAVATGVVTWSGPRQGYGSMVEVTHGNGYVTRYAHNARNLVRVGDHVQQGETIALMGSTGRATGPNLHFEVWHDGRPVDPQRFIRQAT
jgi:murein DD-endopeptidase MepM/ murein hydrolase activator NlpD